ncbi:non-hydrolyzing UDP-N-acetylglucosamine 2-epimerase [Cupriavidus basilensis]|uniref:non-hydrolyzing UDP-N-acetylglucosamine 2-epimerase n=1 Tax=Cupriavidus basilensis TaxID=68895 RepID=UPI0020A6AEEC|nr:UDP-N-acetylglucosamine 2-epimerase (non-hydrolyzing) [Cupriavidus basilensis]MCP3023630.1 UDP-N-acetylglucosamine 2-epimerase (non-hydrolyzing) [Cupriavidus basilensis]MDR3379115.1 UDP-N-acetylglucosamine 2-epimerase (non-hydrolyzing) [Cupriavidus basilensis]
MRVLSIVGTRPEAIKMAPLVQALNREPGVHSVLCLSGQHRQMLDQVMSLFALQADYDLAIMAPNQTLNGLFGLLVARFDQVFGGVRPDHVLVHGDTTTAAAAAVAAFHRGVPVAHVEAGLRTGNLASPFPEEMNRRVADAISGLLFAPTPAARDNLLKENLAGEIFVTGNTVIDALALTCQRLDDHAGLASTIAARHAWLNPRRRLLLVTGHRRESFGEGFERICEALALLARRADVQIVYPVHLNPRVRETVMRTLAGIGNVHLIDPLEYLDFVWLMRKAYLVLTDSGGVQEEAPHLGKPVLVMRDTTERPEAVAAGTVKLVGTDTNRIVAEVNRLLDDTALYEQCRRQVNPYGDGRACQRIVAALCGRPLEEFRPAARTA